MCVQLKACENNENLDKGFSLLELVISVGVIMVLAVAGLFAYPQINTMKKNAEVQVAAQTAYDSGVNTILGLGDDIMPIDEIVEYVEGEYKNTEITVIGNGSDLNNFCVIGEYKGEEGVYTSKKGLCGESETPDVGETPETEPEETEPPVEIVQPPSTITKLSLQCDTTSNLIMPFYGSPAKGILTITGNDGSVLADSQSYNFYPSNVKPTYTFTAGVVYDVTFDGTYATFGSFPNRESKGIIETCLTAVTAFPNVPGVTGISFQYAQKLVDVPSDIPPTVTVLEGAFRDTVLLNDPDLNNWDVSNVTNMRSAFNGAKAFNQPLNKWDTGSVVDMTNMFYFNKAFSQNLSSWDVSSVTSMDSMFGSAVFNGSLSGWDARNVTSMRDMFRANEVFNQPLNTWNTSSVTDITNMFYSARSFNQDLDNWDISNVTSLNSVFYLASAFDGKLDDWDTSNVTDMEKLFSGAWMFNQPLNSWDVSKVTDFYNMFGNASKFNQDLNSWDTSSAEYVSYMFINATDFNGKIDNWRFPKVTSLNTMFRNAKSFNQPLNNWDVSNVTNFYCTFHYAESFNQPLDNWDMSSAIDLGAMFTYSDFEQDISTWVLQEGASRGQFVNSGFPKAYLPTWK